MKNLTILEKAAEILKLAYMCDSCIGRCFAQLLSGWTNAQRGAAIRIALAMAADSGEKVDIDMSNFSGFRFRQQKFKLSRQMKQCWVCGGLLDPRQLRQLAALVTKVMKKIKGTDFKNFHIGVILSKALSQAEEKLWEAAGIEWCESIKAELSREIGKRVSEEAKKEVEMANPEIVVLVNLEKNAVELKINPLFIYGRYKKFVTLPQTRWDCRECRGKGCESCGFSGKMYPSSVEEKIAKPILKATRGVASSFHGAGREDMDVKCLDWRAFVLEIAEPKVRDLDFKFLERAINRTNKGKIAVSGLRFSDKEEVRAVKASRLDKTYRIVVLVGKKIARRDVTQLKKLVGVVHQRTPTRVVYRRSDITRKRRVKSIACKLIGKNGKKLILDVKAEAGLYVKEFVTGDKGRTKPSVAEVLGTASGASEAPPKIVSVAVIKISK